MRDTAKTMVLVKTSVRSILQTGEFSFFASFYESYGAKPRGIFRMSVISVSIPTCRSYNRRKEKAPPEKSPNELAGYRIPMSREEAVRKCLVPANLNARANVRKSQDLTIVPNSEDVYAIF